MARVNKKVRERLKQEGLDRWTPDMVDKVCFTCGNGFDPNGPAPKQVVKPGTKDATRYYPLGAYTHQTHAPGSLEWYLNLDPQDQRDARFITYYHTTYGPHPGRPKNGLPWRVRLDMMTLPLSSAPADARVEAVSETTDPDTRPMAGRPVRRASALSPAPGANETARRSSAPAQVTHAASDDREHFKEKKVDLPAVAAVTAGLNGRSLKELEKIAKVNGMEAEWKTKWSKMPNPGMVRMQMGNVLRNRAKKGISVHLP